MVVLILEIYGNSCVDHNGIVSCKYDVRAFLISEILRGPGMVPAGYWYVPGTVQYSWIQS